MTGPLLGYLKNGAPVYDRPNSHIHTEYEDIFKLIRKTLPLVEPKSNVEPFFYTHDFGDTIGESICVETEDGDEIVFAQRRNRNGLTRFVKSKPLQPTSSFTVVLIPDKKSEKEQYLLITAYVGEKAPEEPWDKFATPESVEFWNSHALVWGSMPIVEGTETSECPW